MNRILIVIVALFVVIKAHEHRNVKPVKPDLQFRISKRAEGTNENTQQEPISIIAYLNMKKASALKTYDESESDDEEVSGTSEDSKWSEIDEGSEITAEISSDATSDKGDGLNTSDERSDVSDVSGNISRRKHILYYLATLFNKNRNGNENGYDNEPGHGERSKLGSDEGSASESGEVSRLGIEDNDDLELTDGNPGFDDVNQGGSEYFRPNRRFLSYGAAMVDVKGRSGMNFGRDNMRSLYKLPLMTRRGLFLNAGINIPWQNVPSSSPVTFTKIESNEIFNPMNNAHHSLYPINVPNHLKSRRLEIENENQDVPTEIDPETEKIEIDPDSNAYAYVPED